MEPVIFGSIGLVLILLAFFLEEMHDISNTYRYNLLNLVGAGFLVYYSITLNSIPFIILQTVWGTVALWKPYKLYLQNSKRKH